MDIVEQCELSLERLAADELNAVIALDPTALDQARTAAARQAAGDDGALLGRAVLVKDNIAVTGLPTTAGSRALADSRPTDAALITRLRAAGAVIVGKANLSEWANFRSRHSTSGWSAIGGQTHNPHVLDRNTSGSSSGSAAAVAAGLVPLAIGTETDGSIVSPAGICGIVGFKATRGAVPGGGIVPVSSAQDVAGPMTRTVAEAAAAFAVLSAGHPSTLRADALRGRRVGVWVPDQANPATRAVFEEALAALAEAGATAAPMSPDSLDASAVGDVEWPALLAEFKHELTGYLATTPGAAVADLAELMAFNLADDVELRHFGQENLAAALAAPPLTDPAYREQRAATTRLSRALIDDALAAQGLDVIMTLSNGPAWLTDYEHGDAFDVLTSTPAAAAGYPTISVPAGFVGPLPIGVSFIATGGADSAVLNYGYAFEQLTRARRDPTYRPTLDPAASGDR